MKLLSNVYRKYAFDFLLYIADIDECLEEADSCRHICVNTNGSYTCQCLQGFRLERDGFSCIGNFDITEAMLCCACYNNSINIDGSFETPSLLTRNLRKS